MPYKIGGGFKLEAYDPDNGQYTEEEKIKMRKYDEFWLKQPLTQNYEPHIPTIGIHDFQYTFNYVEKFKHYLWSENNKPEIKYSKAHYLLDGKISPDKTKWLNDLGFKLPDITNLDSTSNKKYIQNFNEYIIKNTEFKSLYFMKFRPDGSMLCNAITTISGHKITTGWKIDSNFKLNFVTLIPTSKKYYEEKNKIRRQGKVNI